MGEHLPITKPPPPQDRSAWWLALLVAGGSVALAARPMWTPTVAEGLLVEVSGAVARPGLYVVDPPTLALAVELAGGRSEGVAETLLRPGDAVLVEPTGAVVVPSESRRLLGLEDAPPGAEGSVSPINLNTATVAELQGLPGVGPKLAQRILDDRAARGPYPTVASLDRVAGIGPALLARVGPMVAVDP